MDIVQFIALLSNIVSGLRKKGENDKANELSGAMNKIGTNEQLQTEQKKYLEDGIKRARSDSYINIVDDYYDNKDNVLDRCFFITKKRGQCSRQNLQHKIPDLKLQSYLMKK